MTKQRRPLTFSGALTDIASVIGWDVCAQVLGKSESYVRKLSDPDAEREISLREARRLDAVYIKEGGEGAPLHDCYAVQLELTAGGLNGCTADIVDSVSEAIRENGEAISAALIAIKCGSKPARIKAIAELQESVQAQLVLVSKLGGADLFDGGNREANRTA